MSKKSKLSTRVKRRAEKRMNKEFRRGEFMAKMESGRNRKAKGDEARSDLVRDTKGPKALGALQYVKPNDFFRTYWS